MGNVDYACTPEELQQHFQVSRGASMAAWPAWRAGCASSSLLFSADWLLSPRSRFLAVVWHSEPGDNPHRQVWESQGAGAVA